MRQVILALAAPALVAGCMKDSPDRPSGEGESGSFLLASAEAQPPEQPFYDALPPRISPTLASTTLGKALVPLLSSGPTLRAARAQEDVAASGVVEAQAAFRPTLDFSVSSRVNQDGNSSTAPSLAVRQRIFDGGAARNQLAAARSRTVVAGAQTVDRVTIRALEAISAWEELHLARRIKQIAQASLSRQTDIAAKVARRVEAGAGNNAETLRVQSRRAEAAASLATANRRVAEAQARVRELYGHEPKVSALPKAPSPDASLENNAALIALRAEEKAAENDLATRRAQRAPTVFLDVTGRAPLEADPDVSAGLSLDYAIGSAGRRQAAVQTAEAELDRIRAEIDLARADLKRALEDARTRETALGHELSAARASRNAARAALDDAQSQFEAARVDLVDLLDLGRELDRAENALAELESSRRIAGYERLAASGDLLDAFGVCLQSCGPT